MTPQEVKELNERLLKKIGFKRLSDGYVLWYYNDKFYGRKAPNLPNDIAACFKWLVPELGKRRCEVVSFYYNRKNIDCDLSPAGSSCATIEASADTESMALCLAADRFIKE